MRVQAMLDQHGTAVQNTTAYTKGQRRKASRQMRTDKGMQLDLSAMQKRAEADTKLRCKLSHDAQHAASANERAAAAKAKRKLNDMWTNRRSLSLGDYWKPGHASA